MERKINSIFLTILLTFISLLSACSCSDNKEEKAKISEEVIKIEEKQLIVNYIDCGEGDAILINFSDGKNMLIDCGENTEFNIKNIDKTLKAQSVNKIDYFILTHTDTDHIGNAEYILNNYSVDTIYHPYFFNVELFPNFKNILSIAEEKQINCEVSSMLDKIVGEDYKAYFLYPYPIDFEESPYYDLLFSDVGATKINNASAVLYLEYCGVRFMFTGDIESEGEKVILNNYKVKIYSNCFLDEMFSLENIDFLKVAHHGASDSSSTEFLSKINPKNAIISCGYTYKGNPSTETLLRFQSICPECSIYRTDILGTIKVKVFSNGEYKIGYEG